MDDHTVCPILASIHLLCMITSCVCMCMYMWTHVCVCHFREGEQEWTVPGLTVWTHLCLSTTLLRLHHGTGISPEIPHWEEESKAWCHTVWSLSLERDVTHSDNLPDHHLARESGAQTMMGQWWPGPRLNWTAWLCPPPTLCLNPNCTPGPRKWTSRGSLDLFVPHGATLNPFLSLSITCFLIGLLRTNGQTWPTEGFQDTSSAITTLETLLASQSRGKTHF